MGELVVLAAGASSRMGHPKALTPLAGEAALARIVRAAEGFRVLVVLGEHHDAVRAALPGIPVEWIRNPAPEMGRTGSLQRGLARCRSQRVLVLPVDHPLVRADTLRLLSTRHEAWVVPMHAGKGGHPLSLGEMGIAAVMSAPPSTPLRDVPRMVGIEATRVAVDDPGILANLDTPDDVFQWSARHGKGI